jgi:hypothetical protein
VSPDHEAQSANRQRGADHGFIAKNRFAREDREQVRRYAHCGQYSDINFRVPEKPEEVLPHQRRTAGMIDCLAADQQSTGNKEVCTRVAIKHQQDHCCQQDAEGEKNQN